MKMNNKVVKIAICAILAILTAAATGHASKWCRSGTVTQTGPNPYATQISAAASPYVIFMTCEEADAVADTWTTPRRFVILDDENKDANYATALSAAASGKSVETLLMGTSANSLIEIIYLKQ
ncbi:MAG: hypothetical protein D3904_03575 [Candidatus Electrothrix sp. EH2]|nr:hypothetical protein [Candidatus Electrothrix sp. EH2]